MKTTTILGLGFLGFALLALITVVLAGSWIEDDLAEISEERLEAAGIAGISIDMNGRTAILNTDDTASAEDAIKIVQEIWGIRAAKIDTD
jgi:hypothetical protein